MKCGFLNCTCCYDDPSTTTTNKNDAAANSISNSSESARTTKTRDNRSQTKRVACRFCGKEFNKLPHVNRHMYVEHFGWRSRCKVCKQLYTVKDAAATHVIKVHGSKSKLTDRAIAGHCIEQVRLEKFADQSWHEYIEERRKKLERKRPLISESDDDDESQKMVENSNLTDKNNDQQLSSLSWHMCLACDRRFNDADRLKNHLLKSSACLQSAHICIPNQKTCKTMRTSLWRRTHLAKRQATLLNHSAIDKRSPTIDNEQIVTEQSEQNALSGGQSGNAAPDGSSSNLSDCHHSAQVEIVSDSDDDDDDEDDDESDEIDVVGQEILPKSTINNAAVAQSDSTTTLMRSVFDVL